MGPSTTAQLIPPSRPLFDETRLAVGGFLARYSGNTRAGYAFDLRACLAWCAQVGLEVFAAGRAHIELYARCTGRFRRHARRTASAPVLMSLPAIPSRFRKGGVVTMASERYLVGDSQGDPKFLAVVADGLRQDSDVELLEARGDPSTPTLLIVSMSPKRADALHQQHGPRLIVEADAPLMPT